MKNIDSHITGTGSYWAKRFKDLEGRSNAEAQKCAAESAQLIDQELVKINKDITYWLQRFGNNNNMTLADAKKAITNKDLKELGWDVEEYIRKGRENSYTGQWTTELENASARFHITRLDAMKMQIQKSFDTAFTGIADSMTKSISSIYKDVHYRTAYEIQKGTGIYSSFAEVDENKLRMLLEKPWAVDGSNFSQRVWGQYRPKLVNKLQQSLTDWCVRGTDPKKLADTFSRECGIAKSACQRLIHTESAQICTRAEMDSYDKLGIEKYRILESLDDKTCDICAEMDGQVFSKDEYEVGVTAPPFHPNCRGTTIPEVEDDLLKEGRSRAARNLETGKTENIKDMSYKEWKEKFVNNEQFTEPEKHNIIKGITPEIRDLMDNNGITNMQLSQVDDSERFAKAIEAAKESNPHGGSVDTHTIEELKTFKTFLSSNDMAGVAVKPDGDIVAVFKNSNDKRKGAVNDLIITARANGGTKMDCYGRELVKKYEQCGYIPVARIPFNADYVSDPELLERKPDVYAMMKNSDTLEDVIKKCGQRAYKYSTREELDSLPTFEYDRALMYRDNLLKAQQILNNEVD